MSRICVRDSHIGRRLYQQIYKGLAPGEGGMQNTYMQNEPANNSQAIETEIQAVKNLRENM